MAKKNSTKKKGRKKLLRKIKSPRSTNISLTQDTQTRDEPQERPDKPPKVSDIMTIIEESIIPEVIEIEEKGDQLIYQKFLDAESALKILCNSCKNNITKQIKFLLDYNNKENISINERFGLLCINCFSKKFIFEQNDTDIIKNVNYRIINKMSDCLFIEGWPIKDELKFIEAISKLGLENWFDISRCIGKGVLECRNHYFSFYYKSQNDFLPSERVYLPNKINSMGNNDKYYLSYNNYTPNIKKSNRSNRSIRHNRHDKYKINENEEENNKIPKELINYFGYNPKRKEFEQEYKNESEIQLSEMEFEDAINKDDRYKMRNIYYEIFKIYNDILNWRKQRENFVVENDLIDVKRTFTFEKKLSKDDKEIFYSLKQYLKYLNLEKFNEMFQNFVLEKNIRIRINQLIFFKEKGFNNYDDIHNYLQEIRNNNNKKKNEDIIYNPKLRPRDTISLVERNDTNTFTTTDENEIR